MVVGSLAGLNTAFPTQLNTPVFLVLGVYSGSGVTRETLNVMQTWPGSFAILAITLVAVVWSSTWWLHRRCGWKSDTALLASLPGALSLIVAVGGGLKADMKLVIVSQTLRVLLLVEFIPLIALLIGHPTGAVRGSGVPVLDLRELAILFAAGAVLSVILVRLRFPGGWMVGGLIASGALFLTGVVEGRMPPIMVVSCTVALAALSGCRFRPGDLAILPRIAGASLSAFAIACAISAIAAGSVSLIFGINFIQTVLAFAPGAFDALTILAFQMNIDPAYVAAHHVARFIALSAAVPLLGRWLAGRP